MNLSSLPDVAALLILMGVLNWLRRRHRDASVNLWMLALTFILIEAIAFGVLHGSPGLSRAMHAVALDAYLLAAVTFGWAAREDLIPGLTHLPLFLPPAVPLLALCTAYGLDIAWPSFYLNATLFSLVAGVVYILFLLAGQHAFKARLLLVHLVIWAPMSWMAYVYNLRLLVYWGLGCLYLLVAVSFRKRVQPNGIGGLMIVSGFCVWALCFFAHAFVRRYPEWDAVNAQIWTMQKFFVIIGMVLVLLEEQTRRLQLEAIHDALTGLPNRRLFDDRLAQALGIARRSRRRGAVFVVDLDKFKQINDEYGHRSGDLVLIRAGEKLKSRIRATDTIARAGGDEFNIIVTDLQRPDDCRRIAEGLRNGMAEVEMPEGVTHQLSGSIGYAIFPDDGIDAEELCDLADVRMYKDKRRTGLSGVRAVAEVAG